MEKPKNIKISNDSKRYLEDFQTIDDLYWKDKLLVFTWHIKKELEAINKPLEFVIYILENGEHKKVAKQKYNVFHHYKKKRICLSYAIHENIILIHIKPIK